MKIGFTGTQKGMTTVQLTLLAKFFLDNHITEFHHGDCIGADAQAHLIAIGLDIPVIIHPPEKTDKQAYCKIYSGLRPRKPYLKRNHDIVNETEMLIVCPDSDKEKLRSGTWATCRYGKKQNKRICLITPDGKTKFC